MGARHVFVCGELELKTRLYVYISHFLSAWGDRMWSFGVGLFLIHLAPEDLRLVAIFGFSSGGSILLMGAIVGDWVDRTGRMKAARVSLVIQNLAVFICSIVVFFVFMYHEEIKQKWPQQGLADLCYAGIIIIAIISNLSSMARKIAVERDWIVEICGRDKDMLATMTSKLRAIDLSTAILAPIATGQIISFTAIGYGALFIAGWNLLSVIAEYYLIWKVYQVVPALRNKKKNNKQTDTIPVEENLAKPETEIEISIDVALTSEDQGHEDDQPLKGDDKHSGDPDHVKHSDDLVDDGDNKEISKGKKNNDENGCFSKMFSSFITLYRGWRTYVKYDVAFAGFGLAMLYMTVLGFDNITVGFAYSQGVPEWVLGILMAAGSIFGILGTFAYPRIRLCIGLERTGLFGLGAEIFALTFCVVSVWTPGSPFDLLYASREPESIESCFYTSPLSDNSYNSSSLSDSNFTINLIPSNHSTDCNSTRHDVESGPSSFISVSLLMAGIIGARFGLWIADLTITQLFLQSVIETERGIVNGVQTSLNQLMDMLKFIMVIIAPRQEIFGLLVLISFFFICLGWVFYAKYSRSVRGHLFHFEKVTKCVDKENNNTTNRPVDQEPVTEM